MKRAIYLLLVVLTAHAEDLTTIEGKTYRQVMIRKVEPDGLSITHESGLAKVPFTKLAKEIQQKHGYDPEQAKAYAEEQFGKLRAAEAAIEKDRRSKPEPMPMDPPGQAVPLEKWKSPPADRSKPAKLVRGKKGKEEKMVGQVIQVVPEGLLFVNGSAPWLLIGYPRSFAPRENVFVVIEASKTDGVYRYTDVIGGERVVPVWEFRQKRRKKMKDAKNPAP